MQTLKEAREARGIKQVAVADAIGVARQTYAGYESDQDTMTVKQAKKACEFIGLDPSEIFLPTKES